MEAWRKEKRGEWEKLIKSGGVQTSTREAEKFLPVGSPVMAMEFLLNEDKTGSLLAVFQWYGLLSGTPGDQRTGGEIAALMEKAGFRDMEVRPVDTEHSIAIGWKR